MPGLLGSLGSFFGPGGGASALLPLAGLGATGAGLIGNIQNDQERQQALNQAKANAALTPSQLSSMVSQATQPLNSSLVQAITGQTNANLAEQGLSEAPGLIATATSQALAPFEQQNQNTALQLVMQKLGLPANYASLIPPNSNMSQLLALLMRNNNPYGGASQQTPFNFSNVTTGPQPLVPNTGFQTDPGPNLGDFGSLFPSDSASV